MQYLLQILRDPIWQFVAVIVTILLFFFQQRSKSAKLKRIPIQRANKVGSQNIKKAITSHSNSIDDLLNRSTKFVNIIIVAAFLVFFAMIIMQQLIKGNIITIDIIKNNNIIFGNVGIISFVIATSFLPLKGLIEFIGYIIEKHQKK